MDFESELPWRNSFFAFSYNNHGRGSGGMLYDEEI